MNQTFTLRSALTAGLLVAASLPVAAFGLEAIVLRSGNGPIGGLDSQITQLVGPANSPFPAAFTAADFAAADAGPAAPIIANNGAWINALTSDPLSRWISTSPGGASEGGTTLTSQAFIVTTPTIGSATLDFFFAVDNVLGSGPNVGIYLNGLPVPGTTGGSFSTQFAFTGLDVASLLQPGLNRLYVDAVDQGGPGGLLFRAELGIETGQTVDTEDQPLAFQLGEAWPNPFNPSTEIAFEMAETEVARLAVHDLAGREVAVLVDGLTARGEHRLRFDATRLPAGLYFYTLQAGGESRTRKLLLVK
jgi:hypothetical protein